MWYVITDFLLFPCHVPRDIFDWQSVPAIRKGKNILPKRFFLHFPNYPYALLIDVFDRFISKDLHINLNVNAEYDSNKKKTTYALKTPSVVALPFIYGVECIIISNQKRGKNKSHALGIEVIMCLILLAGSLLRRVDDSFHSK